MAGMTRREKLLDAKLPKLSGEGCIITGIICDDFMVDDEWQRWPYHACCQDPDNWKGRGDWKPLQSPEEVAKQGGMFSLVDPYWFKGFRKHRRVWCSKCDTSIIATEYSVNA